MSGGTLPKVKRLEVSLIGLGAIMASIWLLIGMSYKLDWFLVATGAVLIFLVAHLGWSTR